MDNIITNTYGAKKMAEILANVNKDEAAKARRKADRMSRATRSATLEKLGVKVIVPVTAAASKKAQWEEEGREAQRQALRVAREAVKAKAEEARKANEAFATSTMAQAMAKALAAKA